MNNQNLVKLQVSGDPNSWEKKSGKIPLLLVGINMPQHYSLAIRILARIVDGNSKLSKKYEIRFLEFVNDQDLLSISKTLEAWSPALLGISVNIWNQSQSIELAGLVKKILPDTTILCGGQEVTNSMIDYLHEVPEFDYIIDGEGELPFQEFLENWDPVSKKVDYAKVSGLLYRKNGVSHRTTNGELVQDLDELPSVVLEGMVPPNPGNALGVMLEGTRGCPFRCAFCFEGYKKCSVRSASIERLIAEIMHMANSGSRYIHILDPIFFNTKTERLQQVVGALRHVRENFQCYISIEAYADQISEKNIGFFKYFSNVDIGLQSTNQKTLEAINRRYSPEKFEHGLQLLHRVNANIIIYLICGLPYETPVTFLQGIQFVISQNPNRMFCNELLLLNGTELRLKADELGYSYNPKAPYEVYSTGWMNKEVLATIQLAASIVSTRYNFSKRKTFSAMPGYCAVQGGVDQIFHYSGGCSRSCKGCRNAQVAPFSKMNISLQDVLDTESNRLDIKAGTNVQESEFLKIIAQAHLADINYIQLTIPCDAPIDNDFLLKLVRFSILHYRVFIPAEESVDGELSNETKRCLSSFIKPVDYGEHSIKPYLEIVVLAGDSEREKCVSLISGLVPYAPNLIEIVDDKKKFNQDWNDSLVTTFRELRDLKIWLKLPDQVFSQIFNGSDEVDEIIKELKKLDLAADFSDVPPCHR